MEHKLVKIDTYKNWEQTVKTNMQELHKVIQYYSTNGYKIVGYGAAAKGNTLLNYAGVKPDLLEFVCDLAKAKQNKFMPGSHIPICDPKRINWSELDFVVVLPWNIASEVKAQLSDHLKLGALYVMAVPKLTLTS